MISIQKSSPAVYTTMSRDYQFIGHLYDLVLNAVKTNADSINSIILNSENTQNTAEFIKLWSYTLGFNSRSFSDIAHLKVICQIFPELVRHKGSETAIELLSIALTRSIKITDKKESYYSYDSAMNELTLKIPGELTDVLLINEILKYILPAGVSCRLIRIPVQTE